MKNKMKNIDFNIFALILMIIGFILVLVSSGMSDTGAEMTEFLPYAIIGLTIILSVYAYIYLAEHNQEKQEQKQKEWQKDRYFKRLFKSADWEEVVEIAERK